MYCSVELSSDITTSIPVDSELVPAERLLQLADLFLETGRAVPKPQVDLFLQLE
jgi:hypothetical protein